MLTNTQTNRRQDTRVSTKWPVWIRNQNSTFQQASLVDLSQGGAALSWSGSALSGDVHIVVKVHSGQYLTFNARAAWQSGSRVGLRFSQSQACTRSRDSLDVQVTSQLARSSVSLRCTVPRARLRRDRTVPTGMSMMSATSL
jgi:hypothetical protein